MIFNFGESDVALSSGLGAGIWKMELASADSRWLGPQNRLPETVDSTSRDMLSPLSFVVLSREPKA
jgi:hypothetical protein